MNTPAAWADLWVGCGGGKAVQAVDTDPARRAESGSGCACSPVAQDLQRPLIDLVASSEDWLISWLYVESLSLFNWPISCGSTWIWLCDMFNLISCCRCPIPCGSDVSWLLEMSYNRNSLAITFDSVYYVTRISQVLPSVAALPLPERGLSSGCAAPTGLAACEQLQYNSAIPQSHCDWKQWD